MKVLILSITTGQGHHATGEAVQKYFQSENVECRTLDAYEYIQPLLKEVVSKGYLLYTAYTPKLASKAYGIAEKKKKPVRKYSVSKLTNTVMAEELQTYIDSYDPDVIICTHVLAASMINILLEKKWIYAITVGVVTDFTMHPIWEETRSLDYYVTPSELLEYQMRKKGLDPAKMLPTGIPIRPRFSKQGDREDARRTLGLDLNRPTLLIMSGSMGYGKIDESIEQLDELSIDFQAIVVCGNNKKMFKKVSSLKTNKRFDVYGYVDNVDVMMDAADAIVTKPGGITSSEALAKGIPMIMLNPIPGHEVRNAEFMLNNGLALYATKTFTLDEAVFSLFMHPDRIQHLRQTIALYGKQDATKNLCEFLIQKVQERETAKTKETEKAQVRLLDNPY